VTEYLVGLRALLSCVGIVSSVGSLYGFLPIIAFHCMCFEACVRFLYTDQLPDVWLMYPCVHTYSFIFIVLPPLSLSLSPCLPASLSVCLCVVAVGRFLYQHLREGGIGVC